jgi:hypothetical protein
VAVARRPGGLSGAILPFTRCTGLLLKSLDQLPQHAAIWNVVQAVAGQIHLLAKLRELCLPDNSGGCAKSFHTAKGVLQFRR